MAESQKGVEPDTAPPVAAVPPPVLEVEHLCVSFPSRTGILKAVDDVSFALIPGRTLGLIGESGCGKTVTAQAILRLVQAPGKLSGGRIVFHRREGSTDLASLDPTGDVIRRVRGREIAMIFQEPTATLSPVHTISAQLCEALRLHRGVTRREAEALAAELLDRVGLTNPRQRLRDYPHQLSGGMCQRVAIALALCGQPRVLIADEPTTALDLPVQAQIVDVIRQLQTDLGMAVLFITHDLRLVGQACDDVAVMYLGQLVEHASVLEIFRHPLHPYTSRLLDATPRLGRHRRRLPTIPGTVPADLALGEACRFVNRCDDAMAEVCEVAMPALVELEPSHRVRCFLHSPEQETN